MLEMSIGILQSFTIEWALLHHIDNFMFKLKVILALDRAEKSLMHLRAVATIGTNSTGMFCP
jgi:hypothetical protein